MLRFICFTLLLWFNLAEAWCSSPDPTLVVDLRPHLGLEGISEKVRNLQLSSIRLSFLDQQTILVDFAEPAPQIKLSTRDDPQGSYRLTTLFVSIATGAISTKKSWQPWTAYTRLWPLNDGRMLIRIKDKLSLYSPGFEALASYAIPPTPLLHAPDFSEVGVSRDRTRVLVLKHTDDRGVTAEILDAGTLTELGSYRLPRYYNLALSQETLLLGTPAGVRVWPLADRQPKAELLCTGNLIECGSPSFLTDSVVILRTPKAMKIRDLYSGELGQIPAPKARFADLVRAMSGTRFGLLTFSKPLLPLLAGMPRHMQAQFHVYDFKTMQEIFRHDVDGAAMPVAIAPDGSGVAYVREHTLYYVPIK